MELTGGAECGATGGDEKSKRVEEGVSSGGNVRVDLPTQRCWALHDEIAVDSEQDGMIGDFQDAFPT